MKCAVNKEALGATGIILLGEQVSDGNQVAGSGDCLPHVGCLFTWSHFVAPTVLLDLSGLAAMESGASGAGCRVHLSSRVPCVSALFAS